MGYREQPDFDDRTGSFIKSGGILENFRLRRDLSLSQRAQFTQALSMVAPVYETCDAKEGEVVQKIETLLGQPVGLISSGPRADNVKILRNSLGGQHVC